MIATARGSHHARHIPSLFGVRLNDSAAHVLRETQHTADRTIVRGACARDYLHERGRVVAAADPDGHCVQTLTWSNASENVGVTFQEDLPNHPGLSVVSAVSVSWLQLPSGARTAQLAQLRRTYGPPTDAPGVGGAPGSFWCFDARCNPRAVPPAAGRYLFVGPTSATLFDQHRSARRSAALDKILSQHHITLQA